MGAEWSVVDIAEAVRGGRLTARQAVADAVARIEAAEGRIAAYQVVRADAALREADEVDARTDRADLPMAGVPVAIKDNVPVAGEPMRAGSACTPDTPQARDHEIVRRLRAAGAVIVGITRVPELCVFGTTDSSFGITRNPWDLALTPGGSSGGSAAAVAAGTVPVAHGNDGMGSIRIPSACCGLVGIKPGLGVVPADLGEGSWFGMAENGPLATTVADCALTLAVLADRPGLATVATPPPSRIAWSTAVPMEGVRLDPHWAAATRRSAELLRAAGHTLDHADPPYGRTIGVSEAVRWTAGTELDARLLPDRSGLTRRTARHAALGRLALRAGLPREQGRRSWQDRAGRFFDAYDVLVTPALARAPVEAAAWAARSWVANVWSNSRYAPFAAPWNLAGWPAMSVPAGTDPQGRPLAVQLVTRAGGEALLLSVAAQLEQLRPWTRIAPAFA
ncbi:MAG TPA: amidase family protein [Mycobacteriales bacterium]